MNAFAARRINAGIRQEDVARELKVDRSTVAKWETNKAFPRSAILPQLARLYKCTIDELLVSGESEDKAV